MPDINYVHPQINNTTKQEISIQVSLSGFSFLIKSAESGSCLLFRNYKFEKLQLVDELIRKVDQIISEDQYLATSFVKSELIYISQKATLIPEEFFSTDHLKKYFEFNHSLDDLDELHYTALPSIEAYNVFTVPTYLSNVVYSSFSNIEFRHQASNIINYGKDIYSDEYSIVVSLYPGFFDMVIFEDEKLLLYNSYQFTNALEFIYFFLYPCNQIKIDVQKQNVIVLGETQMNKALLSELTEHVKEVILPEISTSELCNNFNKGQKLEFFNLFQ